MIINTFLSVAFLWTCRRCIARLKELGQLRKKIVTTGVMPVSEAISMLASLPQVKKKFMIVRGLIKMKIKMEGEKSIYSLMETSKIRKGRLSEHLMRRGWEQLASEAFWKQPFRLKNIVFQLQDMTGNGIVEIRGTKEADLSGALNEVYRDIQKQQVSSNLFISIVRNIYNYTVSRLPFSWIFNPTTIGLQTTLYSVQNGQYALVVGQFQKDKAGTIFCKFPNYITKQLSYVNSRLRRKYNKLCLITTLLIILLSITGIKLIKELYQRLKHWRNQREAADNRVQEQGRSENEGDNCNCTLCYVSIRNVIFKPCRHYAVCKSCYQQLPIRSNCPFCKIPIEGVIEVIKKK